MTLTRNAAVPCMVRILHLIAGVVLFASPRTALSETEMSPQSPALRVDGALHRIMADGDFSSSVTIDSARISSRTAGVGAVAGLAGEITIIDGRCWVSTVVDGRYETRVNDGGNIDAALLVTADPNKWSAFTLTEASDLPGLSDHVRTHANSIGIDSALPLVFRIAFVLPDLDGHVIDGSRITPAMSHAERHDRAVTTRKFSGEPVVVVGFVSTEHAGVFTHHGEAVHAHAVLAGSGVTVHVDGLHVPEGTTIEMGLE